ncbi:MAG TPA: HAD family phosphatase [Methylomirabilota bacterium]|nr:HAD family phosphatase [Methylomirabilota bacterium]
MTGAHAVRGVIFDFGGVLVDMRWDVSAGLEADHGLPRHSIRETLYRTPTWREIERGQGDLLAWRTEAHRLLEDRVGRSLPRLHDAWIAARQPIRANVRLARLLRPAYRTAILSNADQSLRARLRELGIHDLFDTVVSSAEEGLAKPDAEIYQRAAARLGLPPESCVFVDDYEANVQAAKALGMRGVVYRVDRDHDLAALLAELGVRP